MNTLGKLGQIPQHKFPEPSKPDEEEIPEEYIDVDGEVDWDTIEADLDRAKDEEMLRRWENRND